jgi:hypothetical protein
MVCSSSKLAESSKLSHVLFSIPKSITYSTPISTFTDLPQVP